MEHQELAAPFKVVLQLDEEGYYLHQTMADLDQLADPPRYLMPRFTLDLQEPPTEVSGQRARWDGSCFVYEPIPDSVPKLEEERFLLLRRIDMSVDRIYAEQVGMREAEYAEAEREAAEYQSGGFVGDAPESVLSYAHAAGLGHKTAALTILSKAQAWRMAKNMMRRARQTHKAAARTATTTNALLDVGARWDAALAQLVAALEP